MENKRMTENEIYKIKNERMTKNEINNYLIDYIKGNTGCFTAPLYKFNTMDLFKLAWALRLDLTYLGMEIL